MENSMVILGDEVREETPIGLQRSKTKRIRFTRRNHVGSGRFLPRRSAKPLFHTVFKGLTPALLAIVAVKYQAISEDPSKKFALHIWSFLITILIYSLMLLKMKQSRNRSNEYWKISNRVALAAGVVSCLSLVSMILPNFHGLIVLYASWASFVIISAFPVLQSIYNELLTGITTLLNIFVYLARNLFTGSIFIQQPPQQGTTSPV